MFTTSVFMLLLVSAIVRSKPTSMFSEKEEYSSYLDTAQDMISKAKRYISASCNSLEEPKEADCSKLLQAGRNKSGIYEIWPTTTGEPLRVYCDMDTDGGGWTVIQRRGDYGRQKHYFSKEWESYKKGFGDLERDFWLGNDNIFDLTSQQSYSVRFDLKSVEQEKRYALYDEFKIEDENHDYALHINNYSGNAGDTMEYINNQKFSTIDRDNDDWEAYHCAGMYKSGWWYKACTFSNLNGVYHKGWYVTFLGSHDGVIWKHWKGYEESLEWTEIKIRPVHFARTSSA